MFIECEGLIVVMWEPELSRAHGYIFLRTAPAEQKTQRKLKQGLLAFWLCSRTVSSEAMLCFDGSNRSVPVVGMACTQLQPSPLEI